MYKINEVQAEHHHDTLGDTLNRSARREGPAHLPGSGLGRRSASKAAIGEVAQLQNYNLPGPLSNHEDIGLYADSPIEKNPVKRNQTSVASVGGSESFDMASSFQRRQLKTGAHKDVRRDLGPDYVQQQLSSRRVKNLTQHKKVTKPLTKVEANIYYVHPPKAGVSNILANALQTQLYAKQD